MYSRCQRGLKKFEAMQLKIRAIGAHICGLRFEVGAPWGISKIRVHQDSLGEIVRYDGVTWAGVRVAKAEGLLAKPEEFEASIHLQVTLSESSTNRLGMEFA